MKDDCSILWLYLNVHAESIFLFWRLMFYEEQVSHVKEEFLFLQLTTF